MSVFCFYPNSFEVEIEDKKFVIKATKEYSDKLNMLAEECEKRSKDGSGKGASGEFFGYIIDELLGQGASETIFGTSNPDVYGAAEVISYVCDEFTDFQNKRKKKYLSLMSENESEAV